MPQSFTWVPFFEELAQELLKWRHRQPELIEFLESLRSPTTPVTPLMDRASQGTRFLLEEIDPFTFLGVINRNITQEARQRLTVAMKSHFNLEAPLPLDFNGVPTLIPMSSWFIGYKSTRGVDDVANLWTLLELALQQNPLQNEEFIAALERVLSQRNVNINITMALFWVRPDTFVSLDSPNRSFLGIKLPTRGLTAGFYRDTLNQLRASGRTPADVSHEAWLAASRPPDPDLRETPDPRGESYWMVGAFWAGVEPEDQTSRFLEQGVWENGYEDKYIDEVRSIQVGDRIAIKAASTQKHGLPFDARGKSVSRMSIKAVGTVVKNPGDGRSLEVEWDSDVRPRDWYFFTNRSTVWRIRTDSDYHHSEFANRLIDFVWYGAEQDYDWFAERWFSSAELPPDADAREPYGSEDIVAEGVFMDAAEVEGILDRIRTKKAIIIQGPPGVGKTFIARKLAFALMEERKPERVRMLQFHQSYAYEDFIRGYRPQPDQAGAFALRDGTFFEFCKRAQEDPDHAYVFIIDEINRGNLSQIFGETLMLIEADKRHAEYALPLVYHHQGEDDFYVPSNVYLIGLMNVADRSLAMIDYALRRRFAFVNLEPHFDHPSLYNWLHDRGMSDGLIDLVVKRMSSLNATIEADPLLGRDYRVGHSFFTPRGEDFSKLDETWYRDIVRTEVGPLLHEYWYDNPDEAEKAIRALETP